MAIFDSFLKNGARHQISDCSSEDRTKIIQGLDVDEPSCNVFAFVQSLTFRSLKFTWYPDFAKSKNYSTLLRVALNKARAVDVCSREDLLVNFLGLSCGSLRSSSSLESPPECALKSPKAPSSVGLLNRVSGVFRKPSSSPQASSENRKGRAQSKDSNGSTSAEDRRLTTPWRRAVITETGLNPFDKWITDQWWEYVDVHGWRFSSSNNEFEQSLVKMMPTWMPLDRTASTRLLESVHRHRLSTDIQGAASSMSAVQRLKLPQSSVINTSKYTIPEGDYLAAAHSSRLLNGDPTYLRHMVQSVMSNAPSTVLSRNARVSTCVS